MRRSVPLKLVLLGVDLDVALLYMLVGTMGTLPKPVTLSAMRDSLCKRSQYALLVAGWVQLSNMAFEVATSAELLSTGWTRERRRRSNRRRARECSHSLGVLR